MGGQMPFLKDFDRLTVPYSVVLIDDAWTVTFQHSPLWNSADMRYFIGTGPHAFSRSIRTMLRWNRNRL